MTARRYSPLSRMSLEYSTYLSEPSAPNIARFHDLGKSDDGVERRAQFVAHVGEKIRLRLVGLSAARFLFEYFSASSASCCA